MANDTPTSPVNTDKPKRRSLAEMAESATRLDLAHRASHDDEDRRLSVSAFNSSI